MVGHHLTAPHGPPAPAPVLGLGGVAGAVASASSVSSAPSGRQEQFTEQEIAAGILTVDNADADGDGWCSLLDYAFGTNPRSARERRPVEASLEAKRSPQLWSQWKLPSPERYPTLSAHRTALRADIRWQIESPPELIHWSADDDNLEVISDSWTRLVVSDRQPAGASARRCFRVRIVAPLKGNSAARESDP